MTEVLSLLCVCVCRVDWIEGKERNQTHTKRELERQCNSGQRIASHCTWADEEEEAKKDKKKKKKGGGGSSRNSPVVLYTLLALDDCVINVPSPSLQMEPARFFIFSFSNGVSRVR